ncbi:MAG TPA: hypothetical protein VJT73_15685 [Polyangiaceae bacterium]|nr:hypothetical protein [Polyangiaceae bacterium]
MGRSKDGHALIATFREAIEAASHLKWRAGLQAIKNREGGGQISSDDPERVLGGATIDDDCLKAYPTANRWDYVVGYRRPHQVLAYFIEVHSAETSEISKVEQKLHWLRQFLRQETQEALAKLPREFHWIASGRINIPKHVPQYKRLVTTLRTLGLRGPTRQLKLT